MTKGNKIESCVFINKGKGIWVGKESTLTIENCYFITSQPMKWWQFWRWWTKITERR